jgi:uncharacterized protein YxeA
MDWKNTLKKIVVILMAIILIACGEIEPSVTVDVYDKVNPLFKIKYVLVKVTAIVDEIEVQNVIVNRGNCKIEGNKLPKTLFFGQSISVAFSGPCQASEVEVITDDGDWIESY